MAKTAYPSKPSLKGRRKSWVTYLLTFLISFCLLTTGVVIYIMKVGPDTFVEVVFPNTLGSGANVLNGKKEFNILAAGLDELQGVQRTDSIIVAHVNLKDKYVTAVSIPRDTKINIPGRRSNKINAAYAFGGRDLLIKSVEDFLDVEIDFYAVFSIQAATELIDAMGGVDLYVEKNMRYRDRAQDLNIDLKKGEQHLDGEHAMQFARFRHDRDGDISRIGRQQKLLKALANKATSLEIIKHLPRLIIELVKKDLVDTNLGFKDLLIMSKLHDEEFSNNIVMIQAPATPVDIEGISYLQADREELDWVVKGMLSGGYHPHKKDLNIIVKNGCGSPMIAQTYSQRLGYFGFEVLKTENAADFDYEKTKVIVKKQNPFSQAIADLLEADLEDDPDAESIADIEIILGKDKL